MNRPKMVKVRWKARLCNANRCDTNNQWWVLGDCSHWTDEDAAPMTVYSKRKNGPVVVRCYECPTEKKD